MLDINDYEVYKGWIPLVKELNKKLDDLGDIEILQIKTKFGGLRCYIRCEDSDKNKQAKQIIKEYEQKCADTCEFCGCNINVNVKSYNRWLYNICDNCYNNLLKERIEII